MKLNHVRKLILSILITLTFILGISQNIIYAVNDMGTDDQTSLTAKIAMERYTENSGGEIKSVEKGYTYKDISGDLHINDNIFQILEVNSDTTAKIIGKNLYCLNANKGNSWTTGTAEEKSVTYTKKHNLKTESIETINGIIPLTDTTTRSSIVWLLDNFYIQNKTDKEEYLKKVGFDYHKPSIVGVSEENKVFYYKKPESTNSLYHLYSKLIGKEDGTGYAYKPKDNDTFSNVILPDELIESVQQAAIWYFTNYKNNNENNTEYYNELTSKDDQEIQDWIGILNDGNLSDYNTEENTNGDNKIGEMYQEQASILYNYLVEGAIKAGEQGYTGKENEASITLKTANGYKVSKDQSGNYSVGKFKVETSGEVSDIKIIVKKGDQDITSQCNVPSNILSGEEFSITNIPADTEGNITIIAEAKGNITKQTLWTNDGNTEQPLVKIERGTVEVDPATYTVTNEELFDLALRKVITQVKDKNGNVVSIVNEEGNEAVRTLNIDKSTIPVTATYKHRKDPVVVAKDYTVVYDLYIYNEGDIDGYASIIVDQLPLGLESTLNVGDTVTSTKNNKYKVKSYDNNKLVLELDTDQTPNAVSIPSYNGNTLSYDSIKLEAKVTQEDSNSKHYLTNIAYINQAKNKTGDVQAKDRKDTESEPEKFPTWDNLNTTDRSKIYHGGDNYNGNNDLSIFNNGTNNDVYFMGKEDDDDFETVVVLPKEFDLKLVKYISALNGDTSKGKKVTNINTRDLASGAKTTADYTLSKNVVTVEKGDYVTYTFRVYNEGDIDGYVTKLTDNIPLGLQFVQAKRDGKMITVYSYDEENGLTSEDIEVSSDIYDLVDNNNSYWTLDKATDSSLKLDTYDGDKTPSVSINVKDYLGENNKLLNAYDKSKDNNYDGAGLTFVDVTLVLKVSDKASINKIIRNEAAITGHTDAKGDATIKDRDSEPENWIGKDEHSKYQDDEDYDHVKLSRFDLALRKFISALSKDSTIEEGEYLTDDGTSKTTYTREPQIDSSKLKTGEETTAIYNHSKDPISVSVEDYLLYTIRVYNEGDIDGYASQITDYLPEYLNYIDGEFNKSYGWEYNASDRSVTTKHLSHENGKQNILKAFDSANDNGKGSGLDYNDIPILCRVNSNAVIDKNITNIAEITEYEGSNGEKINEDVDSEPDNLNYPDDVSKYEGNRSGKNASDTYYPGQQDDDDFDRVIIKEQKFDLALRKFITQINDEEVTTRIPKVSYKDGKITYKHPKDVLKVIVGDTVTYTIRVFNEGQIDGFAQTLTDDIPEYLEYLPQHATNIRYRWKMYDKDGNETQTVRDAVKIVTDYTSKENGKALMETDEKLTENPNLLKAFNSSEEISDNNPDYVDIQVAFRVLDPNSSEHVIVNKAQISEDADENGNPIDDVDSKPNEWNEGEDDQDYENVSVEYFDLALLKYVSEVKVTENGVTKTRKTGNNGSSNDIIPKVEIHRKRIKSTVVKFIYTIKITNQGSIPGYATEITDYVPNGLEFFAEDNKGWKEKEDGVITTDLLSNTLLKPGESATVKVTFRWKNNENNMGVKTNVAEISKDKNDRGIPDRDSTPGNNKKGEDDIDDAEVLLSIKTGLTENIITYVSGAAVILLVLAGGVVLIKKFVL